MTVSELREKLELIDGECEVLVFDKHLIAYQIEDAYLDPWFEKEVLNGKTPLCIRLKD